VPLAKQLQALSADIAPALDDLPVCAVLIDGEGRLRWGNKRFTAVFGDLRGRPADTIIAPEDRSIAKTERSQKLLGLKRTSDYEAHLMLPSGEKPKVEISSVALDDGTSVVGIFGVLHRLQGSETQLDEKPATPKLTPRQHEVLRLLAHGHSTRQIAEELHLSVETVRNHVRGVLKGLGVHSRIEALAVAFRDRLL
jgi:DNA-binding CsgD family transcriptional regulator